MRERDIRKTLRDVCDTLDRHRSKASAIACGTALFFVLDCGSPGVRYGVTTIDSNVDSSNDRPNVLNDADGTDSVDQGDVDGALSDAPALHYAAIFDSGTQDNEGG